MKTSAKCTACGNAENIDVFQTINVRNNPELKGKVKDGSLFLWQCPHCGQVNLAVFQTLYHDPDERLMILLLPEGSISEADRKMIEKKMESIAGQLIPNIFRMAYMSVANTVVLQMQDILEKDNSARMNLPSTIGTNWRWRMKEGEFTDEKIRMLRRLSDTYARNENRKFLNTENF